MADLDDPELRRVRDTGGRVTLAIYACRKPVIAAINGAAVGIGATMTLAMDARLMSTKARFGLVFGKLGHHPEACSTWFLPRIVGMPAALDLVYRSDILTADAAREIGLAQAVHEPDALITEARALADARGRATAHRSRSPSCGRCSTGIRPSRTPSTHTGWTRWRCSTRALATATTACGPSSTSGHRSSPGGLPRCRRSMRVGRPRVRTSQFDHRHAGGVVGGHPERRHVPPAR